MTTEAPLTGGKKIAMYVTTGLVGLALVASAGGKLAGVQPVVENFAKFQLADDRVAIGVIELLVAAFFLIPKTSSVGTLLTTGYFGGAIVAHLVSNTLLELVPVFVLGLLAWASGYLRNPKLFGALLG